MTALPSPNTYIHAVAEAPSGRARRCLATPRKQTHAHTHTQAHKHSLSLCSPGRWLPLAEDRLLERSSAARMRPPTTRAESARLSPAGSPPALSHERRGAYDWSGRGGPADRKAERARRLCTGGARRAVIAQRARHGGPPHHTHVPKVERPARATPATRRRTGGRASARGSRRRPTGRLAQRRSHMTAARTGQGRGKRAALPAAPTPSTHKSARPRPRKAQL